MTSSGGVHDALRVLVIYYIELLCLCFYFYVRLIALICASVFFSLFLRAENAPAASPASSASSFLHSHAPSAPLLHQGFWFPLPLSFKDLRRTLMPVAQSGGLT